MLPVLLYVGLEVPSPNKICQRISHLSQLCYITCPSDLPLFDHLLKHLTKCSSYENVHYVISSLIYLEKTISSLLCSEKSFYIL